MSSSKLYCIVSKEIGAVFIREDKNGGVRLSKLVPDEIKRYGRSKGIDYDAAIKLVAQGAQKMTGTENQAEYFFVGDVADGDWDARRRVAKPMYHPMFDINPSKDDPDRTITPSKCNDDG